VPSGVAGAICGSIIFGHTRQLNALAIIAAMPLLFVFAEHFIRHRTYRSALGYGAVAGVMILAGHPQFFFIATALSAFYMAMRIFLPSGSHDRIMGNARAARSTMKFLAFI